MNTRFHPFKSEKIGFVELVDKMQQDHSLKVVNAARASYGNQKEEFNEKDSKLTKFLLDHGHTSPFRHSYYTFAIKLPLFVARQWTKYQVGSTWRSYSVDNQEVEYEVWDTLYDQDKGCSWNELSGRYKELEPEFYVPYTMRTNPPHGNKQASTELPEDFSHGTYRNMMRVHCIGAHRTYRNLIKEGIAKEIARTILPQNVYTVAYWTVSMQSVIHFLAQRLEPDAQYEIRKYAECIEESIKDDLIKLGIYGQYN